MTRFAKSGRGRLLSRSAVGLAAGVLVLTGFSATASAAGSDVPPAPRAGDTRANAEILDAACTVPPTHDPAIINIVHDIATQRAVTPKVMLAAFEAGWVESHMHNLNCGDRDSLGVFQQRPSQGWGTPEQCMDPVHATNAFLDQAIPNDANNPGYTAGQLAQSVQRSAYPERYDQAEGIAHQLIAEAAAT
ncbi:hypothetical protein E4198_16375 [Streptomyces sp. RKND-216]|uniref:hypothetical protein n=1 Tax=Streptomyces sp. RKND-216 TaxID=2562581 RepID=UPI00109D8C70|nr:hypothetical protein [Streptomyces sp. RKND-216]THA26063.1 hypothetical protein E4198_16375 [Streptomyces sp. RKND-216]